MLNMTEPVIDTYLEKNILKLNIFCDPLKFIYSEKATKFCEIFLLLLTVCTVVKSRDAPRGGAGGAAAPPDFGRSEGAAGQRRRPALLPAPPDF